MSEPIFSYEEAHARNYRWRDTQTARILVTIFSQTFPLGNADNPNFWKITEESDRYGNLDVDVIALMQLFKDPQAFSVPVDVVYKPLLSFDEVKEHLDCKTNTQEKYDCFFFVFLTYSTPKYANTVSEERLHFNDTTFEKGIVPQAKILDEVKKLKVAVGKPKIFLFQADDIGLLGEKQYVKGPTFVPDTVTMKIPQDADRIIFKSVIPQTMANLDSKKIHKGNTKKPSFLIQAFIETLLENSDRLPNAREDLYTLSTRVNGKVARMIKKCGHRRSEDMFVPSVESTLTKFIYL